MLLIMTHWQLSMVQIEPFFHKRCQPQHCPLTAPRQGEALSEPHDSTADWILHGIRPTQDPRHSCQDLRWTADLGIHRPTSNPRCVRKGWAGLILFLLGEFPVRTKMERISHAGVRAIVDHLLVEIWWSRTHEKAEALVNETRTEHTRAERNRTATETHRASSSRAASVPAWTPIPVPIKRVPSVSLPFQEVTNSYLHQKEPNWSSLQTKVTYQKKCLNLWWEGGDDNLLWTWIYQSIFFWHNLCCNQYISGISVMTLPITGDSTGFRNWWIQVLTCVFCHPCASDSQKAFCIQWTQEPTSRKETVFPNSFTKVPGLQNIRQPELWSDEKNTLTGQK